MANPQTIGQVLAEIAVLYPLLFQITPESTAIWSRYLADIPDDLLPLALKHAIATAKDKYPPSVGALRDAVADLRRLAAGVPTAYEAWENLLLVGNGSDRLRVTSEYDEDGRQIIERTRVQFSHPLVEQVARQMGWPKFPDPENIMADRAHFLRAYDAALDKLTEQDRELPEVRAWIERARQPALPGVGELTKKLEAT